MTAAVSYRNKVEEALLAGLLLITPENGYMNRVTSENVYRKPLSKPPEPQGVGDVVVFTYPDREEVLNENDAFGSDVWTKVLGGTAVFYFKDETPDASRRFSVLRDFERMIGLNNGLKVDGRDTVGVTLLRGNAWGGMNNDSPWTWVAVDYEIHYLQRITDPDQEGT